MVQTPSDLTTQKPSKQEPTDFHVPFSNKESTSRDPPCLFNGFSQLSDQRPMHTFRIYQYYVRQATTSPNPATFINGGFRKARKPEFEGYGTVAWMSDKVGLITTYDRELVNFKKSDFCEEIADLRDVLRVGFTLYFRAKRSETHVDQYEATAIQPIFGPPADAFFENAEEIDLDAVLGNPLSSNSSLYIKYLEEQAYMEVLEIFALSGSEKVTWNNIDKLRDCKIQEVINHMGVTIEEQKEFVKKRPHFIYVKDDEEIVLQHPVIYETVFELSSMLLHRGGVTSTSELYDFFCDTRSPEARYHIGREYGNFMNFLTSHPFVFAVFSNGCFVSARRNLPKHDYTKIFNIHFPTVPEPKIQHQPSHHDGTRMVQKPMIMTPQTSSRQGLSSMPSASSGSRVISGSGQPVPPLGTIAQIISSAIMAQNPTNMSFKQSSQQRPSEVNSDINQQNGQLAPGQKLMVMTPRPSHTQGPSGMMSLPSGSGSISGNGQPIPPLGTTAQMISPAIMAQNPTNMPFKQSPVEKPEFEGYGLLAWMSDKDGMVNSHGGKIVNFQKKDFCEEVADLRDVLRIGFTLYFRAKPSGKDDYHYDATVIQPIPGPQAGVLFKEAKEINLDPLLNNPLHSTARPYSTDLEKNTYWALLVNNFLLSFGKPVTWRDITQIRDCGDMEAINYMGVTFDRQKAFIKKRTHLFVVKDDSIISLQHPVIYEAVFNLSSFLLRRGGVAFTRDLYTFFSKTLSLETQHYVALKYDNFMNFLTSHQFAFVVFSNNRFVSARRNIPKFEYGKFFTDEHFEKIVVPQAQPRQPIHNDGTRMVQKLMIRTPQPSHTQGPSSIMSLPSGIGSISGNGHPISLLSSGTESQMISPATMAQNRTNIVFKQPSQPQSSEVLSNINQQDGRPAPTQNPMMMTPQQLLTLLALRSVDQENVLPNPPQGSLSTLSPSSRNNSGVGQPTTPKRFKRALPVRAGAYTEDELKLMKERAARMNQQKLEERRQKRELKEGVPLEKRPCTEQQPSTAPLPENQNIEPIRHFDLQPCQPSQHDEMRMIQKLMMMTPRPSHPSGIGSISGNGHPIPMMSSGTESQMISPVTMAQNRTNMTFQQPSQSQSSEVPSNINQQDGRPAPAQKPMMMTPQQLLTLLGLRSVDQENVLPDPPQGSLSTSSSSSKNISGVGLPTTPKGSKRVLPVHQPGAYTEEELRLMKERAARMSEQKLEEWRKKRELKEGVPLDKRPCTEQQPSTAPLPENQNNEPIHHFDFIHQLSSLQRNDQMKDQGQVEKIGEKPENTSRWKSYPPERRKQLSADRSRNRRAKKIRDREEKAKRSDQAPVLPLSRSS